MKKRFIVLVLDGFGIGAMKDAKDVRPGDEVSSTLGSILKDFPDLHLPALEKMGLMNAFGYESKHMKFSKQAVFGKSELLHHGADTFMGHQEIMGSMPKEAVIQPFQGVIDNVYEGLKKENHKVEVKHNGDLRYLVIDDYCVCADNIDADFGMAYNCTAPLDLMPFEQELAIARLVRKMVNVNRVIPFGGTNTTMDDIFAAEQTRENTYIGIHAVKSKSYISGYQCLHLGYGVNKDVQVPTILTNHNIPVSLFGKVADIVANDMGKSISCVDTQEVLNLTIAELSNMDTGFICTNVQETDLAGHSQDSKRYMELLTMVDDNVSIILDSMKQEDILVIMADHGNDPAIGHNRHTRENVPLLIWKNGVRGVNIGLRKTLSDVGASVCAYFDTCLPENGTSFLDKLGVEGSK